MKNVRSRLKKNTFIFIIFKLTSLLSYFSNLESLVCDFKHCFLHMHILERPVAVHVNKIKQVG